MLDCGVRERDPEQGNWRQDRRWQRHLCARPEAENEYSYFDFHWAMQIILDEPPTDDEETTVLAPELSQHQVDTLLEENKKGNKFAKKYVKAHILKGKVVEDEEDFAFGWFENLNGEYVTSIFGVENERVKIGLAKKQRRVRPRWSQTTNTRNQVVAIDAPLYECIADSDCSQAEGLALCNDGECVGFANLCESIETLGQWVCGTSKTRWELVDTCSSCPGKTATIPGSKVCGEMQRRICSTADCDVWSVADNVEIVLQFCDAAVNPTCNVQRCPTIGKCEVTFQDPQEEVNILGPVCGDAVYHCDRMVDGSSSTGVCDSGAVLKCPVSGDCLVTGDALPSRPGHVSSIDQGTIVICPDKGNCRIECGGESCSCGFVTLGPKRGTLDFDCMQDNSCQNGVAIIAREQGNVNVHCGNTDNTDTCKGAIAMIGSQHSKMEVDCASTNAVCKKGVYVELNNHETVDCQSDGCSDGFLVSCASGGCSLDCTENSCTDGTTFVCNGRDCSTDCGSGTDCDAAGVCTDERTESSCFGDSFHSDFTFGNALTCSTTDDCSEDFHVMCRQEGPCTVDCGESACDKSGTILCPHSGSCTINCEKNACDDGVAFYGPEKYGKLTFNAEGDKTSDADTAAVIRCPQLDDCEFNLKGKDNMEDEFVIIGPHKGNMLINAEGSSSLGNEGVVICAQQSGDCVINCIGADSCSDALVIVGPPQGSLTINASGTSTMNGKVAVNCPTFGDCDISCASQACTSELAVHCPVVGLCRVKCAVGACTQPPRILCPTEAPNCSPAAVIQYQ
eukprot:TRINITY_DN3724_c0_g1_i1.p1 TRINITY_DN3724_c0_g1~~TRINITY_DN3724_c0_g1_i1.p1  ORF type:complete len:827 (-),score=58.26 TRINITY_DN3724_c0_g1_i1:239-2614(-)